MIHGHFVWEIWYMNEVLVLFFIFFLSIQVWGLGPEPDLSEEKAAVKPRVSNWETRGGHVDLDDLESQLM